MANSNPQGRGPAPQLTEIFDVLVVGGGPGGTAVAFRARELGLRVVLIEYDDLMKRIRDYSKSKLILPSFGGGDRQRFPKGGLLIDSLQFGPIDKDAMCLEWKALYEKADINKIIGLELTGLKRRGDGCYQVICWDHNKRSEQSYLTRNLVLALGNGVPRRLDIPGNTEGIGFRLRDPNLYVGAPACVIGGGTSAAEAVIDISNAKVKAEDPSDVFWSYRGDRLPRVSKALADVFFEAYVGNGNIRYYPNSEPAAIVIHDDQQSYLSIRVDRRQMDGRPTETTHLEFPKKNCLACIGEDLPEQLLGEMGIVVVRGGPRNKKRVVVNRNLESCQQNVFMVGDLLSQAYLCTEDFGADPSGFEEIKHRGNIKTALRDGVLVAEVIKQKLQGRTSIDIQIEDAEDLLSVDPSVNLKAAAVQRSVSMRDSLPPVVISLDHGGVLHRILPSGVIESEHPLMRKGVTRIGKSECDIEFPDDPLLANCHALISHDGETYTLSCNDSEKDIFMVIPHAQKQVLEHGDLLRLGCQFLLVSCTDGRFWVNHYNQEGNEVGTHFLTEKTLVFGRESPDVTLDDRDMSLSRRHLTLSVEASRVMVKDLKSANHTFLRMQKPTVIKRGCRFQVGSELFELIIGLPKSRRPVPPIEPPPASGNFTGTKPSVTFENLGKTFSVSYGQTICDVAEANGIVIRAECHMGICGSDPIEIVSGRENLIDEASEGEAETLEDICDLEPGKCRLACKTRIKGPVVVKILQV